MRSTLRIRSALTFPNPVDEVSARLVAGGVVAMSVATVALDQPWLLAVIAYGFLARVIAGPTLSPLGLLATRAVRPRVGARPRLVPGPPKRFAQAMGAVMSATAAVLALAFHREGAAYAVIGVLASAAALEAGLGVCIGCRLFSALMRMGIVPERVCAECNDLGSRVPASA